MLEVGPCDGVRQHSLATGTIAASATLGIRIPPSIMLVLMANLLAVSVGNLFIGAILPGLVLSGLYFIYILTRASINPSIAPPIDSWATLTGAMPRCTSSACSWPLTA